MPLLHHTFHTFRLLTSGFSAFSLILIYTSTISKSDWRDTIDTESERGQYLVITWSTRGNHVSCHILYIHSIYPVILNVCFSFLFFLLAKLLLFFHSSKVLFSPFASDICSCAEIIVLLPRFSASVHKQKAWTVLVHALRS